MVSEIKFLKNGLTGVQGELERMHQVLNMVQDQSERNEAQERRFNLLISGLEENPTGENWEETKALVLDFFKEKMGILHPPYIQRAHRIGPFRRPFPRAIMVKFRDWSDREVVLKERKKLRGSNIYINEHFTKATADTRKKLWDFFKGAIDDNGRKPRLSYNKIWFNNNLYIWNYNREEPMIVRSIPNRNQSQVTSQVGHGITAVDSGSQDKHASSYTDSQTVESQPMDSQPSFSGAISVGNLKKKYTFVPLNSKRMLTSPDDSQSPKKSRKPTSRGKGRGRSLGRARSVSKSRLENLKNLKNLGA